MTKRNFFIFFGLFIPVLFFAQEPSFPSGLPVSCDCGTAKQISIDKPLIYGPTIAPEGSGLKQEIKPSRKNPVYSFEKEHHSAWYRLNMQKNGNLCFDIIPERPEDDYDFMLFLAYSDSLSCDSISKQLKIPVRANISRDKKEINGLTGLKSVSDKELIKEGVGEAYSKSVEVKKGQVYYLVLDNVYDKGMGHTLNFYFERVMELSGKVTDDEGKPVKAEITISGPKGEELVKTVSDEVTGDYKIKTTLKENKNYNLIIYNDSVFMGIQTISTKSKPATLQNIKTVLPRVKK